MSFLVEVTENIALFLVRPVNYLPYPARNNLLRKAYASKLPPQVRMKKIPVRVPAVPGRSSHRSPSQHHLVDHELTVIFPNGPLRFLKSGIGKISTLRP